MRKRPRARIWTLEALDQTVEYRLVFNELAHRWDCYDGDELVVTRDPTSGSSQG